MAHRALSFVFALTGLLLLAACGVSPPAETTPSTAAAAPTTEPGFPLTVTDDAGRDVTLETAPERIVSLAPSSTEIVCALGACDRLVGVTDFDDYPPEVGEIADVVIQAQVDLERVVAAEPDLVLAAGNELTPSAVIEQLEDLGLVVMVLYPESLDEVYADITFLGTALDRKSTRLNSSHLV